MDKAQIIETPQGERLAVTVVSIAVLAGCGHGDDRSTVTFTRDVAPIVFDHCATCHHPEGSAPFPLLDYGDVRRHAEQIVEVTGSGFMPPWLPAAGEFRFADDTVSVRKEGDAVILEPFKSNTWPAGFFEAIRIDDLALVRPPQGETPPAPAIEPS